MVCGCFFFWVVFLYVDFLILVGCEDFMFYDYYGFYVFFYLVELGVIVVLYDLGGWLLRYLNIVLIRFIVECLVVYESKWDDVIFVVRKYCKIMMGLIFYFFL